ncbi:hypothetical protein TrLO_g11344 [Triparma laevis f. longispina]|uniref:Glycine transporter domain-containing protein n=1 Tax=Triparma laevis f. longispina TaxID=1714387 RepID=A0A9W7F1K4_9STRA|nr:hypothetical protein TrLO_g11344 [Triparma laevis f. longispina]
MVAQTCTAVCLPQSLIALDWFGTAAFSFSGTLTAVRQDMGIIGAMFLATITALGGGTIRDLLLGSPGQAFWISDVRYFRVVLTTCIFTLLCWPTLTRLFKFEDSSWPFCLADALGLAAFAICGARVGLDSGVGIEGASLSGLLSACGGGIVRDVITNEPPRALHANRSAYATPALIGAIIYVCLRESGFFSENFALWTGFGCGLAMRILAFSLDIAPLRAQLKESEWQQILTPKDHRARR